jgi:hypothetical protein
MRESELFRYGASFDNIFEHLPLKRLKTALELGLHPLLDHDLRRIQTEVRLDLLILRDEIVFVEFGVLIDPFYGGDAAHPELPELLLHLGVGAFGREGVPQGVEYAKSWAMSRIHVLCQATPIRRLE